MKNMNNIYNYYSFVICKYYNFLCSNFLLVFFIFNINYEYLLYMYNLNIKLNLYKY